MSTVPVDPNARYGERASFPFNGYSEECFHGDGYDCDGDCDCPCHGPHAPNFESIQAVIDWHNR